MRRDRRATDDKLKRKPLSVGNGPRYRDKVSSGSAATRSSGAGTVGMVRASFLLATLPGAD
jgi:hypothetical protein